MSRRTLPEAERESTEAQLAALHSGDAKQLEAILSTAPRLIVEAPAGFGKTRTMVSRIAYLLATEVVPYPKRILALTFSVNAAYQIKKQVAEQLPHLAAGPYSDWSPIRDRVLVSNYHGFCRHVLRRYGSLLDPILRGIDVLRPISDADVAELAELGGLDRGDAEWLARFAEAVCRVDRHYLGANYEAYNQRVREWLLPKGFIPYNAVLTFGLQLLVSRPEIERFYQRYLPVVIVDEFQDTNLLSWALVQTLVGNESGLVLMGDPLQRIYGFIGAIPGLMERARKRYGMEIVRLATNHRFRANEEMLRLDRNLRLNAEAPGRPAIEGAAAVPFREFDDQNDEARWLAREVRSLISSERTRTSRVAILTKQSGANIDRVMDVLTEEGVPFFYALFREDDPAYRQFHRRCRSEFAAYLEAGGSISKRGLTRFRNEVARAYERDTSRVTRSLIQLLDVFLDRLFADYAFLSVEDRISLIEDTFEHQVLKQNMDAIATPVAVSTVHGAKGLEWDFVFLPDMEQFSFPNWHGLCGACRYRSDCNLVIDASNETAFLEELSVFYVAVTRARRQVFFSASLSRLSAKGREQRTNLSCFLKLPGIALAAGTLSAVQTGPANS